MGIDAVAILRPHARDTKLRERLLQTGRTRPLLRTLDDGAILWWTLARYPNDDGAARAFRAFLLAILSEDMGDLHDETRGLFLFPETRDPRGRTYDAVLAEVEAHGTWLPVDALSPQSEAVLREDMTLHVDALMRVSRALEEPAFPHDAPLDHLVSYVLAKFDAMELARLDEAARREGQTSFGDRIRLTLRATDPGASGWKSRFLT